MSKKEEEENLEEISSMAGGNVEGYSLPLGDKKPKKKILKPKKDTSGGAAPKKIALPPEPKVAPKPLLDQRTEPLQVSSRLATFTLVAVLKNQGLFDQALEVLDALEKKGESPESISLERDIIQTLIAKFQKD